MGVGGSRGAKGKDYKGVGGDFCTVMGYHRIACRDGFTGVCLCQSLSSCTLQMHAIYFMSITSVNKLHGILNYLCDSTLLQITIIPSFCIYSSSMAEKLVYLSLNSGLETFPQWKQE